MKPTISVAMIVKDNVERTNTIIDKLSPHVDHFYILFSDKTAFEKIKPRDNVTTKHRAWTGDFAKARNVNLKMVKTDYFLWIDDDDIIRGTENLRDMVEDMKSTGTDIMYFPYHYEIDEIGETVIYQWRERIIRTDIKGTWQGVVHETYVPEEEVTIHKTDGCQIYHIKTEAEKKESQERNHKILLEMYNKKPRDPRYTHYLAISHHGRKEWDMAIKMFLEHIQTSGWPEESYRSWINIADCLCEQGKYDEAMDAATQAMKMLPHYPNAYYVMQQANFHLERNEESLEWFSTAEQKPIPETNSAHDPTVYKFRAKLLAVISLMCIGEPEKAYEIMKQVEKVAPKSELFKELMPEVVRAYFESQAVKKAEWLMEYEKDAKGNPLKVLESLPQSLQGDVRLREVRANVVPPITWPKKSIAFFCGYGTERWGADTLDKGMGGSEEAIVYLSRELAKMGWKVTIYNDREEGYHEEYISDKWVNSVSSLGDPLYGGKYHRVTYLPWTTFNPKDNFDVLVSWRNPSFHKDMQTTARVRAVDMHDMPPEIPQEDLDCIDKIFVKSKYHLKQLPEPAQSKAEVISNGIMESYK